MKRSIPAACLALAFSIGHAQAATFVVDSLSDDNAGDSNIGDGVCEDLRGGTRCTLRAAIEEANFTPVFDIIQFGVGSYFVINLESVLPTITAPLHLDGRTEAGYNGSASDIANAPPRVYLSGHLLGSTPTADGLRVSGTAGVWVDAVGFTAFPDAAVEVTLVEGLWVNNCWIGIGASGGIAGNGRGLVLDRVENARLGRYFSGSDLVGLGNVISSSAGDGVYVTLGGDNLIAGNRIGTSPDGTLDRGNGGDGIELVGPNNEIGTTWSGVRAGNRIAHNGGHGVHASLGGGQRIYSNDIYANDGNGVRLLGASSWIGRGTSNWTGLGASSWLGDSGNAIYDNGLAGVRLLGTDHQVNHNVIANNSGRGVEVGSGSGHLIGQNQIYGNGDDGVRLDGDDNTVYANHIGVVDALTVGNQNNGVVIVGSGNLLQSNVIGGASGAAGDGVDIVSGDGNWLALNFIGTRDGVSYLNEALGVRVRAAATNTRIDGNWIGESLHGIGLEGGGSVVCNNSIGISNDGSDAGNRAEGVWVSGGGNTIGSFGASGTCASGNRIGFNVSDGIEVGSSANIIRDNDIGYVNDAPAGNGAGGILIGTGASDNLVTGNLLAHNANDGVRVGAAASGRNRIEQNSFAANGDIGIDLGDNGITGNDAGDSDSGPNNLQNFPVLLTIASAPGVLNVSYTIDSQITASTYPIDVDFYRAGSGSRQGSVWIGRDTFALAPGTTRATVLTLPPGFPSGDLIAMAIDNDGNSSEFGVPMAYVAQVPSVDIFEDGFE